jgi:hypothetical protein
MGTWGVLGVLGIWGHWCPKAFAYPCPRRAVGDRTMVVVAVQGAPAPPRVRFSFGQK